MAQSHKPEWGLVASASGFILGGLGILATLAVAAPERPWCTWWWVALLAASIACVLIGSLLFSNYTFGWPRVELSHAARQMRKEAAHIEAIQAYWSRKHMMDELREELERGVGEWQAALDVGKHWYTLPPDNAWLRHRDAVQSISPEAADAIGRAYAARHKIYASSLERSHEANEGDDTWREFTESEVADRREAQELYREAIAKIQDAEEPQP